MDTSKEYIKMCDCEEIQNWTHKDLDEFDVVYPIDGCSDPIPASWVCAGLCPEEFTWLPRQDQLQEMVKEDCHICLLEKVIDFAEIDFNESFEQLWLRYVMKEKHNKTWNGEGWA